MVAKCPRAVLFLAFSVLGVCLSISQLAHAQSQISYIQLESDYYQIEEGSTLGILDNDSGIDDASLLVLVTQPNNGTAKIRNGQILYAPYTGFLGTDTFTYGITDVSCEVGGSCEPILASAEVTIDVLKSTVVNKELPLLGMLVEEHVDTTSPGAVLGISTDDPVASLDSLAETGSPFGLPLFIGIVLFGATIWVSRKSSHNHQ